ncbi:MAG: mannose-1-phosphate guanylyltransferase/mannose-6-phosphate isomerase [Alphaproteobacteria bacterium]|jgi:mannose-1-phosphate guanylyltransferase/mannose-6-phosphate isomerase|nr:mannose-1-phosphate guanylyltransferase/mannose-6-phosphate isomerase [Alphaproteobacteria bacterium]MBN9568373.1 mannose-1-phosphate guanylyltransferase/mannose-6-phosphate isomerase [Alphaproteobacteria bacterium]MBN9592461.1 mannose-1-phosphate guanylyltransferase/mannose-6-phosphate isomerase [Alphaproteobacteria bacterium]
MTNLFPVILSGGSGTRLWPMSRTALPKQLLTLRGQRTMIQETALRAQLPGATPPLLICNEGHRFLVAEQMRAISIAPLGIVLEPVARNTAAAAAIAALTVSKQDAQGVILLLPSDHFIDDEKEFSAAVAKAAIVAAEGKLVTFGITPTVPETGYGYIKRADALGDGAYAVESFVEKPDRDTAAGYLAHGGYYWNSGMFAFRADIFLDELRQFAPAILNAATGALEAAKEDLDFVRLDAGSFSAAPAISIDYAVMEHTRRAAVIPCTLGWSDVGNWSALWENSPRDDNGNALQGDVVTIASKNCLVHGGQQLTTLLGVQNLAVVVTDDAILVADQAHAQEVKQITDHLKSAKREEVDQHAIVYRPWGSYQTVNRGPRHQVKHIVVKPGGRLSLQLHHKRAEHWTIVEGSGQVTCGDKVFMLRENESTYIPLGARHRLENLGDKPLRLIEVQSGSYLGEDDIVRLEDVYGRTSESR